MCFQIYMLVAILTRGQLHACITAVLRQSNIRRSDKNWAKWYARFMRYHPSCSRFLQQFVVDISDSELAELKQPRKGKPQDSDTVVIPVSQPGVDIVQAYSNLQTFQQNPLVYCLTTLYVGSTFEQMHTIDLLRGTPHPVSASSYYRYLPHVTAAIQKCVEASLQRAREEITTERYVSYDTAWRHKRKCRQASGVLIDCETEKVIDYFIGVIKMHKELSPAGDQWAETNERVDYQEGYPQGLEVKIFHRMLSTILDNDLIIGLVKDNEHDPGGEIKKAVKGKQIVVDLNHNIKHFTSHLMKELAKYDCSKFSQSLIKWMSFLLRSEDLTIEEKHAQWSNTVEHLRGVHEFCRHERDQDFAHRDITEDERLSLGKVIDSCHKYIDLSRPGLHTQNNESLHALMAQLASKNTAWKGSIPARLGLAILRKNEGEDAFLQVCHELRVPVPLQVVAAVNKRTIKRHDQHVRDSSPENKKKKNARRWKVSKSLAKPKKDTPVKSRRQKKKKKKELVVSTRDTDDSSSVESSDEPVCDFSDTDESSRSFSGQSESESTESEDVDPILDAVDDVKFKELLLSGAFDSTVPDIPLSQRKFTGIVNNHQTCYLSVLLQGVAMIIRESGIERYLTPRGRLDTSLYQCLVHLSRSDGGGELHIDYLLRRLVDYHNEVSGNKLRFGQQIDVGELLPTVLRMVHSWCSQFPLFLFSATIYHQRVCNCPGIPIDGMYQWDEGATTEHEFLALGSMTMAVPPLSWQKMVESEIVSPSPWYQCPECGATTNNSRRKMVIGDPPKGLATTLNRYVVEKNPNGELIRTFVELPVSFAEGLVLPFWNKESIEYVIYTPVSIVCHVGQDGAGHYITYNFDHDQVTMISDALVRYAELDDLAIMMNRSVLIFWSCESFTDEEILPEPMQLIDSALNHIRNGTNSQSNTLNDPEEPDPVDEIRPPELRNLTFDYNFFCQK